MRLRNEELGKGCKCNGERMLGGCCEGKREKVELGKWEELPVREKARGRRIYTCYVFTENH